MTKRYGVGRGRGNQRCIKTIAERSWIGCSFETTVSRGEKPWGAYFLTWNVIEHVGPGRLLARCVETTEGIEHMLGQQQEFGFEEKCLSSSYLPSPGEIEEKCREIRAGWSRKTEAQRRLEGLRKMCGKGFRQPENCPEWRE